MLFSSILTPQVFCSPDDGEGNQSGGGSTEPVEPSVQEPSPVASFTQAQLDAIVRDRLARQQSQVDRTLASIGVEGGLSGLQTSYAEQQKQAAEEAKAKGQYKGLFEAEQRRAAELQARFDAIEEERRQASVRESLSSVASAAIAPGQVAQLVQMELGQRGLQLTVRDGVALVTDSEGMPSTDGQGGYMTAEAVIGDFLTRNPHFRKPTAGDGSGAQSNQGNNNVPPAVPQKQGSNPWGDLSTTQDVAKHRDAIMAAMRDGSLS